MQLVDLIAENPDLKNLTSQLKKGGRHIVTGLSGAARTAYLAAVEQKVQQPMLVVADSQFHADQIAEDMAGLLSDRHVHIFPAEETLANEIAVTSLDVPIASVQALEALRTDPKAVVVTSVAGAQRYLAPVADFVAAQLEVDFKHEYDLAELSAKLHTMGYQRNEVVGQPGDFAVRGSIVDVYPMDAEYPVRMDFFDTELDSLRTFEVATQRSLDNLNDVTIRPANELVATDAQLEAAETRFELAFTENRDRLEGADKRHLTEAMTPIIDGLNQGQILAPFRQYLRYLYPEPASLFDYLPAAGLVVFDDYPRALDNAKQMAEENTQWWEQKAEEQLALDQIDLGFEIEQQARDLKQTTLMISPLQRGVGNLKQDSLTNVTVRPSQQFFGQMPMLKSEVERWQKQGNTVLFLTNTDERADKLAQTLADFDVKVNQTATDGLQMGRTQLAVQPLSAGFDWPAQNMIVLTEHELFQQAKKKAPRRQTLTNAERIKSYNELEVGDYVVHVNHGIGVYEGMETIERDGMKQDYITIGYQKDDKIFIPVSQLDLVQKYVGAAEKAPKLNKLGGTEWQKAKAKVAKKVEDIADELLDLYAERALKKGFAFPADDDAQRQFEDAFPYPETADQLRSAEEIKRDMEKVQPMDRLLVGDVGFGKTEVAMRAAFKAAHAGKQVAMLVPTTILAQQHYDSFQSRFEGTGLKIGVLSRFQSTKETKATLAAAANHEIDILIGTHRILSKDVAFADLGLLVIDEEQRFGVKHKERLKEMQNNVDVLTLTATPIPRTLNMSMVGVRDLSVIETPPANRYPIQTYVMEQNGRTLETAIEREMARGGQTFYLHNRVEDIERVVAMIESLVPEARVAFVHGKMTETQLEGILVDFINGEYDVLVTTTIIETGVDIPNANTLFVENADHMGLSQLYQLRGRVGRSNNLAYAYFTYPGTRTLNEESEKRLEAIRDFTELGSGFKIAMRDLSIRGAGDLLGQSQHGFINSVGYDLYMQMLNEAVAEKQGKGKKKQSDAELDFQVEAYLPNDYVPDGPQKIEIYQRIRKSDKPEQFDEITDDLVDRFGELPLAAEQLIMVGRLKAAADRAGVASIKRMPRQPQMLETKFTDESPVTLEGLQTQLKAHKLAGPIKNQGDIARLQIALQANQKPMVWLKQLTDFFTSLV